MNQINILWSFSSIEACISEIFAIKNCYFLALIFVERSEQLSEKKQLVTSMLVRWKKAGNSKESFSSRLGAEVVCAAIIIIIIRRLQSRRLRASFSHNDPVPTQTACPGQSCCLCLPKGVECIWETGFVAFLVFSSHVVEYTVRTPCMAHHQASWVHGPETSVGGFWHFLLAGQSELDHRF